MGRIGVAIIDREPSFRSRVREVLHKWPGFEVVAEWDSSDIALEQLRDRPAQVLLIDLTLPTAADLELLRPDGRGPDLQWVIAVFDSVDEGHLLLAIGAGADACLAKASAPGFIRGILRRVVDGEYPIQSEILRNPNVVSHVLKQLSRYYRNGQERERQAELCPVTKREAEILELAAVGLANKEIATRLEITERTVKNHLYSILRKMEARDRTHAVYKALTGGWIQPQDSVPPPESPVHSLQPGR